MAKVSLKSWQFYLMIAAIGLLVIQISGVYDFMQWIPGQQVPTPTPPENGELPTTPLVYDAATITYTIQNAITSVSGAAGDDADTDISLLIDGVFDPLSRIESVEFAAAPETTALTYNYGDTLVLHTSNDGATVATWSSASAGGNNNETYNLWAYLTLAPGEVVRELTEDILTAQTTSPYTYTITGVGADLGARVQYIAGTTPSWGIGILPMYPRAGLYDVELHLSFDGTDMDKLLEADDDPANEEIFTGIFGTKGINQTRQNDSTQGGTDATMISTIEDFDLEIRAGAKDLAYGLPFSVITADGKFTTYRAVAVIAINSSSVDASEFLADGWKPVAKSNAYEETIFYQVLSSMIPGRRGLKWTVNTLEITVDSSSLTSSTAYSIKVWVLDNQLEANVAAGTLTNGTGAANLPSAYGMITEYGMLGTVHKEGWTVLTGRLLGCQIAGDFTTP